MTHKFAEIFDAAARGEDIDELCQVRHHSSQHWDRPSGFMSMLYLSAPDWEYRRKRQTILINGLECPMPLRVKPGEGTVYWTINHEYSWADDSLDNEVFSAGLCFATEEDAAAASQVLRKVLMGEQS